MTDHEILHFVVFLDGEALVAQCLEYDIVTQAQNYPGICESIKILVMAYIDLAFKNAGPLGPRERPFAGLLPSPLRTHNQYNEAATIFRIRLSNRKSPFIGVPCAVDVALC